MASNTSIRTADTGLFDTSSVIKLRVLAASTGVCHYVSLHQNELSVSNIRSRLAVALPVDDQILLLGPPYKVPKDSLLRTNETISALRLGDQEDDYFGNTHDSSEERQKHDILAPTEKTGSKRLFLFSKRALSEGAPDPPACLLDPSPGPLPMPTLSDMPPPPPASPSQTKPTPLRMALDVYERQFMLDMAKGRAYADGADLRLAACRKCVAEQAVIAQALRAAVSNLADHRSAAARERNQFIAEYTEVASAHTTLLNKFDSRMSWKGSNIDEEGAGTVSSMIVSGAGTIESLCNIALHPSLISAARSAGRVMESLLDAVPIDQEKAWAGKCRTAHERLSTSFHELDAAFNAALGSSASWNESAQKDLGAEEAVKALFREVESIGTRIRDAQAQRLAILTSNHTEAVRIVSSVVKNETSETEKGSGLSGANSAFSELEAMSQSATSIIPSMESDDEILSELSKRIADEKTNAMQRMKIRLRQISIAQSAIARASSSVTVLRSALSHQKSDMEHLDHVVELPKAYNDFLSEIRRRRAYCIAFRSNASALLARLDSMRSDEVKLRERFLKGPGRHLMPAFYEIFAPTLATSPPTFSPPLPDMAELETLPDVGDTSAPGMSSLDSANSGVRDHQGASSTSTITECPSIHPLPPSKDRSGMDVSKGLHVTSNIENPSLIVSAVENSTNDVIMHTVCQEGAAARRDEDNADCATLMYENTMLRQALENAGCKPPRSYIDSETSTKLIDHGKLLEQQSKENLSKLSSMETELAALKLELENARSQCDQLRKAQTDSSSMSPGQKQCDKISHTTFQVGDVGLFMPTGRGRGGKRIYLAFHSGCPHRYLSPDCIDGTPDFILGRIVYQEEFVAGALDSDANPFGLHVGTKYWVLSVETLRRG
eukprot:CCRYP_003465-RA/>CCRYP_003465-RA protein AED:0.26 eAED:0.26 QI:2346/1/1/1/0.5/0.33/3/1356/893